MHFTIVTVVRILSKEDNRFILIYPACLPFSAKIVASRSPKYRRSWGDNSADDDRFNFPCRMRTWTSSSDEYHFSCTWDCCAWLLTNVKSLLSDVRNEGTSFRREKETAEGKPMRRGNADRSWTILDGVYKRSALRRTNRRHLVLKVNSSAK